jgi:hypothetical protein
MNATSCSYRLSACFGLTSLISCSLFFISAFILSACEPLSGNNYGNSWNSGYGGYREPYQRYPHDSGYDYNNSQRDDRYHHDDDWRHHDDDQRDRDYDRRHRDDDRRDREQHQPKYQPTPPPPPAKPPEQVIRPNCPPDTTFDGRVCIVPQNRRRPGGKGTINPCPQGMWLSGDRCVRN